MKCPKCGMRLEEIEVGNVHVDKCSGCRELSEACVGQIGCAETGRVTLSLLARDQ